MEALEKLDTYNHYLRDLQLALLQLENIWRPICLTINVFLDNMSVGFLTQLYFTNKT